MRREEEGSRGESREGGRKRVRGKKEESRVGVRKRVGGDIGGKEGRQEEG